MVDYSKWDTLNVSDSDDEDAKPGQPCITRLDGPSRIKFGGAGRSGGIEIHEPRVASERVPLEEQLAAQVAEEEAGGAGCQQGVARTAGGAGSGGMGGARLLGGTAEQRAAVRSAVLEVAGPEGQAAGAATSSEGAGKGGRLDYSKWDAIGDDLEEDAPKEYFEDEWHREQVEEAKALSREYSSSSSSPSASSVLSSAAASSSSSSSARHSRTENGGVVPGKYCWSQTRDELIVNVFVPAGTTAKQIAVDGTDQELTVTCGGEVVEGGSLLYRVKAPEEDDDIDWELLDDEGLGKQDEGKAGQAAAQGGRMVRVTLVKDSPGGVVVWWKTVFKGDPGIDVTRIAGRKPAVGLGGMGLGGLVGGAGGAGGVDRGAGKGGKASGASGAGGAENMQNVWQNAHEEFKARVKKIEKQEIDVDM
jgi:hypothetical protein